MEKINQRSGVDILTVVTPLAVVYQKSHQFLLMGFQGLPWNQHFASVFCLCVTQPFSGSLPCCFFCIHMCALLILHLSELEYQFIAMIEAQSQGTLDTWRSQGQVGSPGASGDRVTIQGQEIRNLGLRLSALSCHSSSTDGPDSLKEIFFFFFFLSRLQTLFSITRFYMHSFVCMQVHTTSAQVQIHMLNLIIKCQNQHHNHHNHIELFHQHKGTPYVIPLQSYISHTPSSPYPWQPLICYSFQ